MARPVAEVGAVPGGLDDVARGGVDGPAAQAGGLARTARAVERVDGRLLRPRDELVDREVARAVGSPTNSVRVMSLR